MCACTEEFSNRLRPVLVCCSIVESIPIPHIKTKRLRLVLYSVHPCARKLSAQHDYKERYGQSGDRFISVRTNLTYGKRSIYNVGARCKTHTKSKCGVLARRREE